MDPIDVAQLLGIQTYSAAPQSSKPKDLPHWIDLAIERCKSGQPTRAIQRDSLPPTSKPTSDESAGIFRMVAKTTHEEPSTINQDLQEIDEAINALQDSLFEEDIENLETLKFLFVAIDKLQELKWAIKTNASFHFDHLSEENPLIKLIVLYYEVLGPSEERPSPMELLKNPRELVFGKGPILDDLISFVTSYKNLVQNSVHEADMRRIKDALESAIQGDVTIAQNIQKFCIKNQTVLVSVAKSLARQPSHELSKNIESFDIKSEANRLQIAKIAAATEKSDLAKHIKNFSITKEEDRFEIAMIAAKTPFSNLALHIPNFKLSREQLYEIAKILVATPNSDFFKHIANFGLTKEELFKMAKIAAATPNSDFSEYVINFSLTKEELVEMAILAADTPNSNFCEHVGNFNLTEEELFEVAKIAAETPNSNFSEYVANFGLTKEKLFEVARLAADTPKSNFCEHVENFNLTKEELFEVAKIAAETPNSNFCEYVGNFPFTKEELLEVAMIAAKTSRSWIAEHIQNFNTLTEPERIQIAKEAAAHSYSDVPKHIEKFAIRDEQTRLEIAMLAAKQPFSELCCYIKNFKINNENDRVKIALIAVRTEHSQFCQFVQKFDITREQTRLELALIAATLPNSLLTEHIKKFRITHERDRILLAKTAVKIPDLEFSELIENFNINDTEALFDIAKRDLKTNKGDADVSEYPVGEPRATQLSLLSLCYNISESNQPLSHDRLAHIPDPFLIETDYTNLPQELKTHFEKLEAKLLVAKQEERSFLQTSLQFQKCLYLFLYESSIDKALFRSLSPSIVKILDFRNKEVALESTLAFSYFISSPSSVATYQKHTTSSYTHLPMIFFTKIALEANRLDLLDFFETKLKSLHKSVKTDDAKLTPLLKGLITVTTDDSIPPQEKITLIVQFLESNIPLLETMKTLGVLSAAGLLHHRDLKLIHSLDSLKKVFSSLVETHLFKFPVDQRIESFETLYTPISESLRVPYGLEVYTANVAHLGDEALMEAIRSFIKGLCTNSFKAMRYNPEKSPHLQAIDKTVLAKWASTAKQTYQEKLPPSLEAKSSDEFQDLFLCGTEVMDSCQRIDGTPSLVKCLPGYVLNGADQILAITDKSTGKIKSRSILRLLLVRREGNWTPVLYQEKIYPKESLPKDHQIALENMAKKRALELGLELYTASQNKKREESLESLGSPAPWEYVDAQEIGTTEKSQFSITQFQQVDLTLEKKAA